jgi:hypothetical protein
MSSEHDDELFHIDEYGRRWRLRGEGFRTDANRRRSGASFRKAIFSGICHLPQWQHTHDQRQYRHMVFRGELLATGELDERLIDDLDNLLGKLQEDVDPSWAAKFFELLRDLDSIHACARERGDRALSEEETDHVRKIVESLERMIIPKLDDPRWIDYR